VTQATASELAGPPSRAASVGRRPALARRGRRHRSPLYWVRVVVVFGLLAITLIPLFWVLVTSFKPNLEATAEPPTILPQSPTLHNYAGVFTSSYAAGGFSIQESSVSYLEHSLLATVFSTLLVIVLATPAAYAIARHRFRGNLGVPFSYGILAARFVPPFMIILPLFVFYKNLGLLDTIPALVLTYTMVNMPLVVWVIIPSVRQIPKEIFEAATVDGASVVRTFLLVAVPMLRGAMATGATLSLIFAWNEFFAALIFTQVNAATMPLLIAKFTSSFGTQYGALAANACIAIVPVIVLGILAQRHLVRGLTAGAVK
jgi:ABC-type glycerol-3-phosphate transport system permease component